jgi:hypothetical protein
MKKNTVNKPFRQLLASRSVEPDNEHDAANTKYYRTSDGRSVSNVTQEEWDCPRPGNKKYMPRAVKENIKKNLKKINSDDRGKDVDTLRRKEPAFQSK